LENGDKTLIPLELPQSGESPFLERGKAIADLRSFGIFPLVMHSLKIEVRKGAKTSAREVNYRN
jgi:hypothetical protein